MTQWVKVPATKPADLRSIPGSHLVKGYKGEPTLAKMSSDFHKFIMGPMYHPVPPNTHNTINIIKICLKILTEGRKYWN